MSTAPGRGGVGGNQRYRAGLACPICGGSDDDDRGRGTRCFGYLGGDGLYAHCSRAEKAGGLPENPSSRTYAHKLKGKCKCGVEHSPGGPNPGRSSKPRAEIVAEYDYRDEAGKLLFQVVRKADKSFLQRRSEGSSGAWIYKIEGVRRVLYRLPELMAADPGDPVFLVEGEKDVDNLRAAGLVATCNPMGASKWRSEYAEPLAGRVVHIIADNDDAGRDHARAVARSLAGVAREIRSLDLAQACRDLELGELAEKGDASDFLKMGGTAEDLRRAFAAAEPSPAFKVVADGNERTTVQLPRIVCGIEDPSEGLKHWTPKALDALHLANRPEPSVYQRAGKLCRIVTMTEGDHPPSIETLGLDALRGILDRSACWGTEVVTNKGTRIQYGPPRLEIVKDILSLSPRQVESFPPLDSIVRAPRFSAAGRLILEPGYHRDARLCYDPTLDLRGLVVPEEPTAEDVGAALRLIFDELLVDFPFKDRGSRANALAYMLLPFVRPMIDGPTPNHNFNSSTEGVGKGLCVDACSWPWFGERVPINVQKESEAEWRKALTSFFLSGSSHLFLDNLYNPLGWDDTPLDIDSGTLAAAWTLDYWKDRILGGQKEAYVKNQAVFVSAGNNVSFSRELIRRIVPIDIRTPCENPSKRTGFRHDPLREWARANRVALTRACLILCRRWIAAGRPPGGAVMGSYETYARTMGGILATIGVEGFLENLPRIGKDRESIRWPALVEAWWGAYEGDLVTTGSIFDLVFGHEDAIGRSAGLPELQVAFADIVGEGKDNNRKLKFGHAIHRQADRVWGRFRIIRMDRTRGGCALYKLETQVEEEDASSSDVWPEGRE